MITNYTTLLQATVALCSGAWIVVGISRNNMMTTKRSHLVQRS